MSSHCGGCWSLLMHDEKARLGPHRSFFYRRTILQRSDYYCLLLLGSLCIEHVFLYLTFLTHTIPSRLKTLHIHTHVQNFPKCEQKDGSRTVLAANRTWPRKDLAEKGKLWLLRLGLDHQHVRDSQLHTKYKPYPRFPTRLSRVSCEFRHR